MIFHNLKNEKKENKTIWLRNAKSIRILILKYNFKIKTCIIDKTKEGCLEEMREKKKRKKNKLEFQLSSNHILSAMIEKGKPERKIEINK